MMFMPICEYCGKKFVQNPSFRRREIQRFCSRTCCLKAYQTSKDFKNRCAKRTHNIKMMVLIHYSDNLPKCACCGETMFEALSIDHINCGGNKHRQIIGNRGGTGFYRWLIKNNFPIEYQVLCMNCQFGRKHNNGICPHKSIKN